MILLIIAIVLFVLSIIADGIDSYFKNKLAKITKENTEILKQQNTLLWSVLDESRKMVAEAIKETDKVNAKTEEIKITLDGKELFNNLKRDAKKEDVL